MNSTKVWTKDTCEHIFVRGSWNKFIKFECKKCGDFSLMTHELMEELTK